MNPVRVVALFSIVLSTGFAAGASFAWTDINLPSEGRRYTYTGTSRNSITGFSAIVDVTREYSNVQNTASGIRFDVTTVITSRDSGSVSQYVESRELTANNEILLRRDDPNGVLVGADYRTLTFANAVVAPRNFEIGQRYDYSNLFTNPNPVFGGREQRVVRAEFIETIITPAGAMQAAKISTAVTAATGTLMPPHGETCWYARNVGPVKIQISTASRTLIDVSLVSTNFAAAPLAFEGAGPQITGDPESLAVAAGTPARFRVLASGSGLSYAWLKDGVAIPSATAATLALPAASVDQGGLYRAAVTASGVTVQSKPALLTVVTGIQGQAGSLANLSVRANAGDGAAQLIAGMALRGANSPRRMLFRGVGPGLNGFLSGAARDPLLEVRNATGVLLAANDDLGASPDPVGLRQLMSNVGAFPIDPAGKDAALVASLDNGNYSALVRDRSGGIALVECYDADPSAAGGFSNLSARADARITSLIAGIAVGGSGTVRLLVRAVGPTLGRFGVSDAFANPTLRLVNSRSVDIATNDDWSTGTQTEELRAAFAAVGAFPFDENSRDAALIATVPAGGYSAVIDSSPSGGIVLVEVYRLP